MHDSKTMHSGSDEDSKLGSILEKAYQETGLSYNEVLHLLHIEDPDKLQALYDTAVSLRSRYFGNAVYLYGFLYVSTYCRNSCSFCSFRKENMHCARYRKTTEEIVKAALILQDYGVHLLDLTMGEDPYFHNQAPGLQSLLEMVKSVKSATSLPLMISPGVLSYDMLQDLRSVGVSWYACYQETYNRDLFAALRCRQGFSRRMEAKRNAQQLGFRTEEGILCGVGERPADLAESLLEMSSGHFDQLRAMTFVPQRGTPLASSPGQGSAMELKLIAVLRLLNPSKLIPASLDVDGLRGLPERLQAGANVITSIVPPGCGLSGVANQALDIENFNRTVERLRREVDCLGLGIGSKASYMNWIQAVPSLALET